MPLSRDEDARARQLANLRPAPPAPAGHRRSLIHGGHSELLLRDVEREVRELMDALGEGVPVRDRDGGVPPADVPAIERAARSLKRYRHLAGWLDLHGRITEKGEVKPAAELELKAERELASALDALGCSPRSRARLGLDVARAGRFDLAQHWAEQDDRVVDADAHEQDRDVDADAHELRDGTDG